MSSPWNDRRTARYRRLFDEEVRRGECTPFDLCAPWAAEVAAQAVQPRPGLRSPPDPVDRFETAIRYRLTCDRENDSPGPAWIRQASSEAIWGGMYVVQLGCWEHVLGAGRVTVLQYEAVREDPKPTIDELWRRIGVEPLESLPRGRGTIPHVVGPHDLVPRS